MPEKAQTTRIGETGSRVWTYPARSHPSSAIHGWKRVTILTLLLIVSLNALAAGYGFMAGPDGSALGIPVGWLENAPFADYRIPGAILFALGLLYGFAALRQAMRRRDAWFWAGLSGGAMMVWILVQIAMMGFTRHPVQTTLQSVVLAIGATVGVLAYAQLRSVRRGG